MIRRPKYKPLIKLIDGVWMVIPPYRVYCPRLCLLAEQFCCVKNLDEDYTPFIQKKLDDLED